MNKKTVFITQAAIIAAVYTALTWLCALVGLSSGVIQVRVSEALCVLPLFTPAAIPGLTLGCVISNLICGSLPLDVLFGSLATLAGAVAAYFIGKAASKRDSLFLKLLVPLPNIAANTAVIPWVLRLVYGESGAVWYFALTVGIGEIISSAAVGIPLMLLLDKNKKRIFKKSFF